jgi:hypothetical protein
MSTLIQRVSTTLIAVALLTPASFAAEGSDRKPLRSVPERVTALKLDPTRTYVELVHNRAPLETEAVFHADPQVIEPNAVILFQAFSQASTGSIERYRCVAIHDIAECLGVPVKIAYLPNDERVVMRISMQNRESNAGGLLLAERKQSARNMIATSDH